MLSEDREERCRRLITEHQAALIERVSRGNTPAENVAGGYLHITGQVLGLDFALQVIDECLFGKRQPEADERSVFDPLGVR